MKRLSYKWLRIVLLSALLVAAGLAPMMQKADTVYAAGSEEVKSEGESVALSSKKLAVAIGESATLELKNAEGKVTFKSGNKSIATVDSKGKISAVGEGVTTITATNKGVTYSCRLTVYLVRMQTTNKELSLYQDSAIEVALLNKKADENLTISSADTSIVSCGKAVWTDNVARFALNVHKVGTTTITVKRTKSVEPLVITVHVLDKADREVPKATEIYQKASQSMVEISIKTKDNSDSLGSGFFIGEGMILTNYHVINGAASIKVVDYEGKEFKVVSIYDYNEDYDLAVLGVEGTKEPLIISEDSCIAGETIYTIGSPYGYTGTFSKGIIGSALRIIDNISFIQITAPISSGNSGGPLLNCYGEVIGVNTKTRVNAQNINFSVAIKYLKKLDLTTAKDITTFTK